MIDTSNINANVAYASVRKATEMKLITSDFDEKSERRVRRLELTEKGRKIAKLLSEVNDILNK